MTSVLLGATKSEQLASTLASVDLKLTQQDMEQLDAASALPPHYPGWFLERNGDRKLEKALGR